LIISPTVSDLSEYRPPHDGSWKSNTMLDLLGKHLSNG
jgi:hypothetical protein